TRNGLRTPYRALGRNPLVIRSLSLNPGRQLAAGCLGGLRDRHLGSWLLRQILFDGPDRALGWFVLERGARSGNGGSTRVLLRRRHRLDERLGRGVSHPRRQ